MDGATFFEKLVPLWRPAAVSEVGEAFFDRFLVRRSGDLIAILDQLIAQRAERLSLLEAPADEWTPSRRAKANLAAMQVLASKGSTPLTGDARRVLLGYSGWGGLSIEKHQDQFPEGWDPDRFGLVHEYYTPTKLAVAVADALCPFLPGLAGRDGVIRALEPAAGIGRFMRAVNQVSCEVPPIRWTAIELSTIAAKILPKLFPDADIYGGSFEEWLHRQTNRHGLPAAGVEVTARDQGKFRLLIANPPYGSRGLTAKWDQAPEYAEREAFAYFLRRGLDLLAPFGIGVFLIPAGFLTGISAARRELRERVLRRHHLMAAYRLPSATFPGANLVTDLLFFRARGGELAEVDEADAFIVEGRYFDEFSGYVLGKEKGRGDPEEDIAAPRGRYQHQVLGEFEGLPPLAERTLCSACIVRPVAFPAATASRLVRKAVSNDELPPLLAAALTLGGRIADYLAERAQGSLRAVELWPELLRSLRDFQRAPEVVDLGVRNPWSWMELRQLAEAETPGAQQFLNAFSKAGELTAALTTEPTIEARYSGDPGDLLGQAEFLYRSRRRLTIDELLAFHQDQGGTTAKDEALAQLFRAEWCVDGYLMQELVPLRDYVTGDLWPKLDRVESHLGGPLSRTSQHHLVDHAVVDAVASAGMQAPTPHALAQASGIPQEQLKLQQQRLLSAIGPVEYEDIGDVSPRDGYIPLGMIATWVSEALNSHYGAIALERSGGLMRIVDTEYDTLKKAPVDPETLWFVGWANHDNTFFSPSDLHSQDPEAEKVRAQSGLNELRIWDYRASYERAWTQSFNAWVREEPSRMETIRDAYNRGFRRYVRREYSGEPLDIARWGGQIRLAPHQNAAARRVIEARGGLLAFDVGVGKTYTGLGVLARARQEGWGRRPVVLVPPSLVWKWHRDFARCLPDYRVAVIGSTRRELSRGKRVNAAAERLAQGEITQDQYRQLITVAKADKPEERAAKWSAFQAGLYDAVILSYEALKLTHVDLDAVLRYAEDTPAIRRLISLQERNEHTRGRPRKKKAKSERKKAIAETGVKGFILERLEVDERRSLDPGIRWEDLGIDLLIVDEAQNFKNLYAPEAREGGIPKYMGLPAGGSKRAWQLDFRSSFVRQRTGGSGVVLLSATPAKNSPLEFYNILQYIDHDAFSKVGIHDPEDFIDRYLKIEGRDVLDSNFDIVRKSAVVGFRRLDELRGILDRYSEFRTAEEVGIKLPKPRVQRVDVQMDDAQEEKYDELVQKMTDRLKALLEGKGTDQAAVLGDMVRMSLIALHSQLDEGYDWNTALEGGLAKRKVTASALPRWIERGWDVLSTDTDKAKALIRRDLPKPDYNSPKFRAIAERIAAQPGCGHIVFCEPVACHAWIREILIEHGIPKDRIAIMNAIATDSNARIRIADGFNGDPEGGVEAIYDVVIANSVAYEGVDLQVRTCAIHHADLPWTPADLEQRNGRAYRQGNTLGVIEILYYIAQGSMDGYRFSVIHGKRGWLTDLLESQDRDTNNPAAQQEFSPEELLEYIARDKSGVRELLAKRKAQRKEEERRKQATNAAVLMRQAVSRFRSARRLAQTEPERATKLRAEAEERLTSLERGAGKAWPWTSAMYAFREVDGIVPSDGSAPVFEGLRVIQQRRDGEVHAVEFGRVHDGPTGLRIGVRKAGEAHWRMVDIPEITAMAIEPADIQRPDAWPEDDDADTALTLGRTIARMTSWTHLHWEGANEAFISRWWGRHGAAIREQLAKRGTDAERLPVVIGDELHLKSGPAIRDGILVSPTRDGWERYLQLAPRSEEAWTALRDVGVLWWGRRVPRDLLANVPEFDDESALARLQRKLAETRKALAVSPHEIAEWFIENDFDRAGDILGDYLRAPTQSFEDFTAELRKLIDDALEERWYSQPALNAEGLPSLREDLLFEDGSRHYVLARLPGHPTRRVYITPPEVSGAPYTVAEGALSEGDRVWDVDYGDDKTIEAVWERYGWLLRALELVPAYLGEAHDLLGIAAEAIDSPKCLGGQRSRAIKALRTAEKYYRRAADRIHQGRPANVLEALVETVRYVTESAVTIAQACGVGQLEFLGSPVLIRERDRFALAQVGEDIVDHEDTGEGADVQGAAGLTAVPGGSASSSKTEKEEA